TGHDVDGPSCRQMTRRRHCAASLDYLVSEGEDRRRNSEAERPGGFEVDDQFKFRRLDDWQLGGPSAPEGPSRINRRLAIDVRKTWSVAAQAAGRGVFTQRIDRRNGMACRQRHDLLTTAVQERFGLDDQRAGGALDERGKGGVYLAFAAGLQDRELHPA